MKSSLADTQARVVRVLISALALPPAAEQFGRTTALLGSVPQLDSMSVLSVVLALEQEFAIQIPEYDITAEEFESVGSLTDYVERRLCETAAKRQSKPLEHAARLHIARTVSELTKIVSAWRSSGARIGLVPTMGALHAGHMALVQAARAKCDNVILTIFVNPGQFTPAAFATYPRAEHADIDLAAEHGVDLVFAPAAAEIYPDGFSTTVSVGSFAAEFAPEGRARYFDSVATIVAKLVLLSQAHHAYFGEKDYEQLAVIRKMARELNLPAAIEGVPTVRERDGLALASSNRFLTDTERRIAPTLYSVLSRVASRLAHQGSSIEAEIAAAKADLLAAGFRKIEYLTVRDAETLAPISSIDRPARVLATAWLGKPRLIDSVAVIPVPPNQR